MIDKRTIQKSKEVELAVPDKGFSDDLLINNIMNDILYLFEEDTAFEGVCLGNNIQLKRAIEEITEAFFIR